VKGNDIVIIPASLKIDVVVDTVEHMYVLKKIIYYRIILQM